MCFRKAKWSVAADGLKSIFTALIRSSVQSITPPQDIVPDEFFSKIPVDTEKRPKKPTLDRRRRLSDRHPPSIIQ